MVIEPEFASILTVMARDGNTLSPVIRKAWDDGDLSTLTKNNPTKATGAHITLITHITRRELLLRMDDTSKGNGFANRFLWAMVHRSKCLPEGATVPDNVFEPLAEKLDEAMVFARRGGIVARDSQAKELWAQVYGPLSTGNPGLTGAILSRAEAQVLRLSVLYALLDSSLTITVNHLMAALAVWEYCEQSAQAIFGNKMGDPIADRIVDALRDAGEAGMTDNEFYELFGRHVSANRRNSALMMLKDLGLVCCETIKTQGRPRTTWTLCQERQGA